MYYILISVENPHQTAADYSRIPRVCIVARLTSTGGHGTA